MIKQCELNYIGYQNKLFQCEDGAGKKFDFKKCRKELIEDFKLTDSTYIGKCFIVSYFADITPNFDVYIITDLQVAL